MKNIIGTVSLIIFLVGCAPIPYDYYRPSAKGGNLVSWGSNLVGPSNAIVLENDSFELKARYTGGISLELFIPEGRLLKLTKPEIRVMHEENGTVEVLPVYFYKFGEPESIVTTFVGRPKNNVLQRNGTHYYTSIKLGKVNNKFTVSLPEFHSESKQIKFSDITFTHDRGVAISPIN